jgi:hypothetical protein
VCIKCGCKTRDGILIAVIRNRDEIIQQQRKE